MHLVLNENNLLYNEIKLFKREVKALLIDENYNILIGQYKKDLLLPGGALGKNENELECLKKNLIKQTGVVYKIEDLKEILHLKQFQKNYKDKNGNVFNILLETTFFIGKYKGINFEPQERIENFHLNLYPLAKIEDLINNNQDNPYFNEELLFVLSAFVGLEKRKVKRLI